MISDNKKAFIAYLTAGDGGIAYTKSCAMALIAGGVDILEIGIPFSDPIADGPVIQAAMVRSLAQRTSFIDVLGLIQEIKQATNHQIPIVLFSYYNPILSVEKDNQYLLARDAGVDAMLIVDLPPESADAHVQACKTAHIAPVFVVTNTTPDNRIPFLSQLSPGFLYYACRKGTTGMRSALPADFTENIMRIKSQSSVPVVVGFGISNRDTAGIAIQYADGFVVGSAFVKAIAEGISMQALTTLAREIDPR